VIGIQDYPKYKPLKGPIADATDFAHWLRDDPHGGGLLKDHCKLITSEPNPPTPVKHQIDNAIEEIQDASENGARRLYFFFSGHGMGTDSQDLALCLATWSRRRSFAALSYEGYFKFFISLGKFEEVAFFLDCCRVREVAVGGYGPEVSTIRPAAEAGSVSTFTAFAAEYGTAAREAKLAEEAAAGNEQLVYGHFTRALMEALRGGAAGPGHRGVSAERLDQSLKKRTSEIAAASGHQQSARVKPDLAPGKIWIFGDYPTNADVVIDFQPPLEREVILSGPDATEIKRGLASEGPWALTLDVGRYSLRSGANEKFFQVRGASDVLNEKF
jgi:hypothetical protein